MSPIRKNTMTALPITMFACLALAGLRAGAAEFQLRSEVHPQGAVVTLGDVAEVYANDSRQVNQLTTLELFPAPPAGAKKVVHVRDVQEFLELRGMPRSQQHWSGASQTTVQVGGSIAAKVERPIRVTGSMARQAQVLTQAAIVRHLQETVDANEPWDVEVLPLEDDQVRTLSAAGNQVHVTGGAAPWTGPQNFSILCPSSNGVATLTVKAKVSLPPAVVAATRSLSRGSIIRANDVQLKRLTAKAPSADAFSRIEDVVGQETTRSVAEGQSLDSQYVRKPLMVKKGEVVTVYVRTSGAQIRTTARSQNDGASGEVVNVESLTDRKVFLARVTAPQEVEVYARGMTVANEPEPTAVAAPPRKMAAAANSQIKPVGNPRGPKQPTQ